MLPVMGAGRETSPRSLPSITCPALPSALAALYRAISRVLEAHKVPYHYLTHFSPDHTGNKEAKLSVAKPMVTSKKQRQSSSSALPLSKDMSLFTRAHSERHQKPAEQSHAHCCKKATPPDLASCCWSVTETPSKDIFGERLV